MSKEIYSRLFPENFIFVFGSYRLVFYGYPISYFGKEFLMQEGSTGDTDAVFAERSCL